MSYFVDKMLDAVEVMCAGSYWLIRETESLVDGRIDGILVAETDDASILKKLGKAEHRKPGMNWYARAANITGLEVKASRADFLRGLREGQFERYASTVSGLFVVTMRDVKTSEIPEACGHITVFQTDEKREFRAACRRQPKWVDRPITAPQAIELMHRYRHRKDKEIAALHKRYRDKLQRIGERASAKIFSVLRKMDEEVSP